MQARVYGELPNHRSESTHLIEYAVEWGGINLDLKQLLFDFINGPSSCRYSAKIVRSALGALYERSSISAVGILAKQRQLHDDVVILLGQMVVPDAKS